MNPYMKVYPQVEFRCGKFFWTLEALKVQKNGVVSHPGRLFELRLAHRFCSKRPEEYPGICFEK